MKRRTSAILSNKSISNFWTFLSFVFPFVRSSSFLVFPSRSFQFLNLLALVTLVSWFVITPAGPILVEKLLPPTPRHNPDLTQPSIRHSFPPAVIHILTSTSSPVILSERCKQDSIDTANGGGGRNFGLFSTSFSLLSFLDYLFSLWFSLAAILHIRIPLILLPFKNRTSFIFCSGREFFFFFLNMYLFVAKRTSTSHRI